MGTPASGPITGTWFVSSSSGSTINITYTGKLGAVPMFSGICSYTATPIGGGDYSLSGAGGCGSGFAWSWGTVSVNFAVPPYYTGGFTGTWGGWGGSGVLSASPNPGMQLFSVAQGASSGVVILNSSTGAFTGVNSGSTISGYFNSAGIGALTMGGPYYAAIAGSGTYGTGVDYVGGRSYAMGGSPGSFFFVDPTSGGIVGKGGVIGVPSDDPGWQSYFTSKGLWYPPGFNAVLSLSTSPVYYAGIASGSGYDFYGATPSKKIVTITSP